MYSLAIARKGQFARATMETDDFELNCSLSCLPNISPHKNQLLLLAMARLGDRSDECRPPSGEALWLEKGTSFRDNYQYFRENATYGFHTTFPRYLPIAEIQFRAADL